VGNPKFAVHRGDEFEAGFIEPFRQGARYCGFPRDCHWLFIGPTGPHIIGKAAARCARIWGKGDIFTVDFDPRWARKMVSGSFAAQRYLEHVLDQALRILVVQEIGVLFSTPPVLQGLCERMDNDQRRAIRGLHLGGMCASAAFMRIMTEQFPHAVILSGYGNTLFGMMPHLAYDERSGWAYFPHGFRIMARVVPDQEDIDLTRTVDYDGQGRIVMHRLDEMQLIVNLVERDLAVRLRPRPDAASYGFHLDGLLDPTPIMKQVHQASAGLY